MNRRTACVLTTMALFGLMTAALPQVGFAQSSPLIGTWKLNLDKSKYSSGTTPRSLTLTYQQDGQNIKNNSQGTDARGNPTTGALMHTYDGQPHPSTGSPDFDASAYTRVDANTIIWSRFKGGKLIAVGTGVVSQDGKTWTTTTTGTGNTVGAMSGIAVFDKQ
jgi:hypothetical protein